MGGMNGLVDIILLVAGIYMIYGAIKLKQTGDFTGSSLWSKEYPMSKCKDKEGLVAYMYPRMMLIGVCVVLSAILGFVGDMIPAVYWLSFVVLLLTIAVIVWYILVSKKAQKMFF